MNRRPLDISNYEAWMLDQMEGRLSVEEELRLNEFLAANPDLDDDFEDVLDFSLSPELIELPDKASLKRSEISDEMLIAALEEGSDGSEFSGNDLKEFELLKKTILKADENLRYTEKELILMPEESDVKLIRVLESGASDVHLSKEERNELAQYKKTILVADERIIYPDKQSLKKEESNRIIPMWVGRLAIAASMIGVAMTLFLPTRPEVYEPRTAQTELPDSDVTLPDAVGPNNLEIELVPLKDHPNHDVNEFAQEEEQHPLEKEVEQIPFYVPIEEPDLELAQEPKKENLDDLLQLEDDELEIAEVPSQEEGPSEEEEPAQVENPNVVLIEEDPIAVIAPDQEPRGSETREIGSVLDLLKHATRDSDVLALQEANKESAYVETSVKVGRFQLAIKRRNRN